MLSEISITGYRSIRQLRLPLRRVTVVVGANGTGKTNLYRAIALLQGAASGSLARDIAAEGGMDSVFWAGGRKTGSAPLEEEAGNWVHSVRKDQSHRIAIAARFDRDEGLDYSLELGAPIPGRGLPGEAVVKSEQVAMAGGKRSVTLLDRKASGLRVRGIEGRWEEPGLELLGSETALSMVAASHPQIANLRQAMLQWRFYQGFRTDPASPLRKPSASASATHLDADGGNLAAVFATLAWIREDTRALDAAIDQAFPGAKLEIGGDADGLRIALRYRDYPFRPFSVAELSDGTLQFLALAGALLSYRPPPLLVLNEPEASLHPDIVPAIGAMVAEAARTSQIIVVTHSTILADAIAEATGARPMRLLRDGNGTEVEGYNALMGRFDDED
ncbi:Predicted ATPase [Devosia enhydra]|uniref:Predicted ATPase n=1 Tax=Devosia enhydra TaxID=665118 RepID=A0A1K2HW34_9HYPH|nr:AAA family ATPase [Devosia enhydra]SFZ83128.1 Predicted ATPase [Devosia enhydra]